MIVFVCVRHAEAASSVAADGKHECVFGLFDDFAFPLEPASVESLPK